LTEVVNTLTTNETYFFREDFQLKTFVREILPEIRAQKEQEGERRLRIWSAGCSSGEEPYTLAMLLLDMPAFQGWQIEIIGTDISQRVLNLARKGVYGTSSFRTTDDDYLRRFFVEYEGKYKIVDRVKNLVTISHLNLFDTTKVSLLGKMDVVFCRNVIIYFDATGKKRVIDTFYQRLRPDGFLLLGHSESLMNITNQFSLRHFTHDMVYQRPPVGASLFPEGL
jgi:chemotaxis protein methyltransferase CheR